MEPLLLQVNCFSSSSSLLRGALPSFPVNLEIQGKLTESGESTC